MLGISELSMRILLDSIESAIDYERTHGNKNDVANVVVFNRLLAKRDLLITLWNTHMFTLPEKYAGQ